MDQATSTWQVKTHSSNGIFKDGFKSKLSGTSDGFLAKFNTSGSFLWGTYYGSGGIDEVEDIAIDKSDNVYITGFRKTTNFLGFFAKFNSAGKHQWYRTLGSSTFSTYGTGISVDANGNIFMGGYTYLSSGIASSGHQNTYGGGGDAFLTKYNDQGTLQWGTYYGGSSGEFATDVQCDGNDNVYLIGTTPIFIRYCILWSPKYIWRRTGCVYRQVQQFWYTSVGNRIMAEVPMTIFMQSLLILHKMPI